jgi:hypothetical protein
MLHYPGYGPPFRRHRRGMLTYAMMTVIGAALAAGLLLAFYDPAPGVPGISLPGSGAVPAPGPQSAPRRRSATPPRSRPGTPS